MTLAAIAVGFLESLVWLGNFLYNNSTGYFCTSHFLLICDFSFIASFISLLIWISVSGGSKCRWSHLNDGQACPHQDPPSLRRHGLLHHNVRFPLPFQIISISFICPFYVFVFRPTFERRHKIFLFILVPLYTVSTFCDEYVDVMDRSASPRLQSISSWFLQFVFISIFVDLFFSMDESVPFYIEVIVVGCATFMDLFFSVYVRSHPPFPPDFCKLLNDLGFS